MGKFSKSNFRSEVKQILDQVSINQQQITAVSSTANTAKSTADTANTNASAATTVANEAKTAAQTATTTANTAKSTADTATTVANEAKTAAQNATTIANEAKQLGNSVKQNMVSSLLSVDSSLPITTSSTWDDVINQSKNIKTGIDINGIIKQYKVEAGQNVSAGDFVQFITTNAKRGISGVGTKKNISTENNISYSITAALLTDSQVLVAFNRKESQTGAMLILLKFTGLNITGTASTLFSSNNINDISLLQLGDKKVLMVYGDGTDKKTKACIITQTEATPIVRYDPSTIITSDQSYFTMQKMADNTVLCVSRNSYSGELRVLTINSDNTISTTSATTFSGSKNVYGFGSIRLSASQAIVMAHNLDDDNSYAILVTVSGTTISYGAQLVFDKTGGFYFSGTALSSSKAMMTFMSAARQGTALILTVSGTSLTASSTVVFETSTAEYMACDMIDSTSMLVAYVSSSKRYVTLLSVDSSRNVITVVDRKEIDAVGSYLGEPLGLIKIDGSRALVTAISKNGAVPEVQAVEVGNIPESITIKKSSTSSNIHGVSEQTGSGGATVNVRTL